MMGKRLYIHLLSKLIHYTEQEAKATDETSRTIFGSKQQAILECLIEGVDFKDDRKRND